MNIDEEFEKFIEFPSESKYYVTTVSAKLFALHCVEKLESAIVETLSENLHLADGEDCTLIKLKRALGVNLSCDYCGGSGVDPDNLTGRYAIKCPACKNT